jgi:PE family
VSALTAAQFAAHAGGYQAITAQAAVVHSALVSTLQANAASYASAEAANAIAAG